MKISSSKKRKPHRSFLRPIFFGGILLILGTFGILSTFGDKGILHLFRLKNLHQSLQKENKQLIEEQEDLFAEIARLEDPKYMEFLAKEKLGLLRPNEFFIILDTPKSNSTVDNVSPVNVPEAVPRRH